MMSRRLSSLIAPRYPRRYIGRHRARTSIRFMTRGVVQGLQAQRGAEPAGDAG
jgi:hypothetical protein